MTQENKELLIKDLCARLPYGVKVQSYDLDDDMETIETLREIDSEGYMSTLECDTLRHIPKPYLFPLSSMTKEQKSELSRFCDCPIYVTNWNFYFPDYIHNTMNSWEKAFTWLNKHHFDYRGLIEQGLAIDATGLNIY